MARTSARRWPPGKPICGICLGNQLLADRRRRHHLQTQASATAATTSPRAWPARYNTGYVTSQNHGFAVDDTTRRASDWEPLLRQPERRDQRGHPPPHACPASRPSSTPRPRAGPAAITQFLFDDFLRSIRDRAGSKPVSPVRRAVCGPGEPGATPARNYQTEQALHSRHCAKQNQQKSSCSVQRRPEDRRGRRVRLIPGPQALKALKDTGRIATVLINPNIATDPDLRRASPTKSTSCPGRPTSSSSVIAEGAPRTASCSAFGGQTALNCGVELYQSRACSERYGVQRPRHPRAGHQRHRGPRERFVRKLDQIDVKTIKERGRDAPPPQAQRGSRTPRATRSSSAPPMPSAASGSRLLRQRRGAHRAH